MNQELVTAYQDWETKRKAWWDFKNDGQTPEERVRKDIEQRRLLEASTAAETKYQKLRDEHMAKEVAV